MDPQLKRPAHAPFKYHVGEALDLLHRLALLDNPKVVIFIKQEAKGRLTRASQVHGDNPGDMIID